MKNQKSRWRIKKPAPKKFLESYPEFNPVVLQLLYNRGIEKEEEIEKFLNPDWERDLYDPFLLKGMKEAVKRIKKAIKNKEKIGLFGHFDVDGIASLALLYLVFKKLGVSVFPYLPGREEGYGLTKDAVSQFHKEKVNLIITADNGSTSQDGVNLANQLGLDVIITDHHEVFKPPPALAFINPHQKSCKYPFKDLAGVGVAFKLVQAISPIHRHLKWFVDLVALGTISDVVPLIDENRIFAKFGLIVLQKTKRIGLKELYQIAKINPATIDAYTAGFMLGPRLNAPGRMDHASPSFYLLITNSKEEAKKLARELDKINRERQAFLEKVLKEARREVERGRHLDKKLILIGKDNWPTGLIGLIAGKLKDEYCRPVIALALGPLKSRGSARSIDALHITEVLAQCEDCLVRFGGHKKAAGFSVLTDKIKELREKLVVIAEKQLTEEDILPQINIDAKLPLSQLNWDLWQHLENFEPTGFGNNRPVFATEGARVEDIRQVGKAKQHLKLKLYGEPDQTIDALFFGRGDLAEKFKEGDKIDVAFQIMLDEWNNERRLSLRMVDIKSQKS